MVPLRNTTVPVLDAYALELAAKLTSAGTDWDTVMDEVILAATGEGILSCTGAPW